MIAIIIPIRRWLSKEPNTYESTKLSNEALLKTENFIIASIILLASSIVFPDHQVVSIVIVCGYAISVFLNRLAVLDKRAHSRKSYYIDQTINWCIFISAIMIIYFRDPDLFNFPRFWAEDGKFFYAHFFNNRDWIELFRAWEYYRILHNFTAFFTVRWISLENAPLAFTIVSAMVTVLPVAIVTFGKSICWNTPFKKIIIVSLYFLVPFSQENWLNLNGTSYTLTFVSLLILLANVNHKSRWMYRSYLLLAGLTGLLSCLFIPLFGLRAWLRRNREHTVQFILLLFCGLLQFTVVFYENIVLQEGTHLRITPPSVETLVLVTWLRAIVTSFSVDLVFLYTDLFRAATNSASEYFHYSVIYGLIVSFFLLSYFFFSRKKFEITMLIGSFLILTLFSGFFGIGGVGNYAFLHPTNGMRYFYIPAVMFSIILFSPLLINEDRKSGKWSSMLMIPILSLVIHSGVIGFSYINVFEDEWPRWKEESREWRNNSTYEPRIWPRNWKIKLDAGVLSK